MSIRLYVIMVSVVVVVLVFVVCWVWWLICWCWMVIWSVVSEFRMSFILLLSVLVELDVFSESAVSV